MTLQKETPMPHVGQLLQTHFKRKRIFKAALARLMGKNKSVVQRYLAQSSLQVAVLWDISLVLKHNFLLDLAAQLPPEFTINAPDPTLPLQERNAILEEENKLLNAKLEELRAVVRK